MKGEEEDSGFEGKSCYQGVGEKEGPRGREHGLSRVPTTWGWGSLRIATLWGIHSWLSCACSDVGLRELGVKVGRVWWEKLVSMLNLPKANSWVVWTEVSMAPPFSLPPYACCSEKSSGITASRYDLQMWPGAVPGRLRMQRQQHLRWDSNLWSLPNALHPLPSFHLVRVPGTQRHQWMDK